MAIFAIGINHKTAPIRVRERAYFPMDKLGLYLQDLLSCSSAKEAVLLSTCNRSELYCEAKEVESVIAWFSAQTTLTKDELTDALYVHQGEAAIAHLMQVACGLDSMVLGEPQILGQLKEAFSESCAADTVGGLFHRLFQHTFKLAKEIRTTTAIGACPVSVASAAVHFVRQQFPHLSTINVVLVGAGDTAELLIKYLAPYLTRPICLVNRNYENVEKLAERINVALEAATLEELSQVLAKADVVFTATSSPLPIVNSQMMTAVMENRQHQPMLLFDLAVPRNIDAAVSTLNAVTLYCIDDLKTHIEKNRQGREHAARKAAEMIAAESAELAMEIASLDRVTTTIKAYRHQIEEICRVELVKAKRQIYQGADAAEVLDLFAEALTKKLLHIPSVQLRQAGVEGRFELLQLVQQLFAIPNQEVECETISAK